MNRLKILAIAHIFPNHYEKSQGIYTKRLLDNLSNICNIKIISPIPFYKKFFNYFFTHTKSNGRNETDYTLKDVYYPTLWGIPKIGRVLSGFFYFLSIIRTVYKINREFSPEVVISFWIYPDGFASLLVSRILKIPVVITAYGGDINGLSNSFAKKAMTKWALRRADLIISLTEDMKRKMIALGITKDKIRVIYNGVDKKIFSPLDKQAARNILGLDLNKNILLFVGRLSPEKGIIYLIEAMEVVKRKNPSVELLIVGDGKEKKKLVKICQRLEIKENVTFVGEKEPQKIPIFINACDLLCLPSLSEGCPNVILEALACGRPVVASRVGGVPELLVSETMGIMVPAGNSRALAEAILEALKREWKENVILEMAKSTSWLERAREFSEELQRLSIHIHR